MYVPKHFQETRVDVLHALIRAHPLAALVTLTPSGIDANHLPFEIDPAPRPFGTLRGHVARANPLWREFESGVQALAIFRGPASYVSPAWYATKLSAGKVVPTWNYAVVHARGALRIVEDRGWLRALVERLTERHEAGHDRPWKVSDAPADYIELELGAIVGLELPVSELVGKWKVSQNRPPSDREGVAEALRLAGHDEARAMADLVRRHGKA